MRNRAELFEVTYPYKKVLYENGIKSDRDLAESVLNGDFIGLKNCSFTKIIEWLYVNDYISSKEKEFVYERHEVIRDTPKISYLALSDDKYRAKELYDKYIFFIVNVLKLPEHYSFVILIYYLCYYGEAFDYYLNSSIELPESIEEIRIKCDKIYKYLYNLKKNDITCYQMFRYLSNGTSCTTISKKTGIKNIQSYYKNAIFRLSVVLFQVDRNSSEEYYRAVLYKRMIGSFDSWKNIRSLNLSKKSLKELYRNGIKLTRDLIFRYCEGTLYVSKSVYSDVESILLDWLKNNL